MRTYPNHVCIYIYIHCICIWNIWIPFCLTANIPKQSPIDVDDCWWASTMGVMVFLPFFPTCQVRVVRFYVSCLLLLSSPPHLLLISSSSPPPPPRPPPRRPPRPPRPTATLDAQCSLSDLNHDHPRPVFSVGPQPRPSTPSVPCRTSTTTIPAQCSLPDLNHDHPRPVFPAGPQPRVSPPSVPCRTSTATIHAKCSLPDLNREYPRQKICHIECQKICQIEC